MFIAVAGRSNGLGPVLSGNSTLPVINCPPLKPEDISQDLWSSLKVPSGEFSFQKEIMRMRIIFHERENNTLECVYLV